ncbi:lytic transglycosylase domain-containing protein [Sulfuricurvum sp.]|uniref:lytic transglycosylase domain-containing protein n=1 Tax=Sulfuricurvum sp. TaxID=2025608 RepID=UPI002D2A567E|nr:lytic transglycosylase domain-containing protein [Sulfuricurvum sp.]HZF71407.1 lytic transglycosylase domain-containing protein [Sulfuricurvum sp.]
MRFFILALCLVTGVWGFTLDEINDKPASRQKNFMIWQFLHQDINASQASEAFYQIDNVNERFLFDYAAKTDEEEIKYTASCLREQACNLPLIEQDDCLMLALTPAKATALKPEERENIAVRLNNRFGNTEWLRAMNQESMYTSVDNLNNETIVFRLAGATYRHERFNHLLSSEVLEALGQSPAFSQIVFLAVTDPAMDQMQQSLANIFVGNFDPQTHFFLAMNAVKYGKLENAVEHLKEAKGRFSSPIDRDKIVFWLYEITKDQNYLTELSQSLDINMYVLYAREILQLPTANYFTTLPTTQRTDSINGIDPFQWRLFSHEIKASTPETIVNLIDRCDGEDSVGVQGYVLERTYEPYIHNFTMPYDQYMSSVSTDEKALIYALMRQETRFIPGLISRSFALGLMQIMPFNVDSISKVLPLKPSNYFDMLQPEYSIVYSIAHLQHLINNLHNPVLIAYGYNGGLGSTKRLLMEGGRFLPGEYEPFLSMELIGNDENREYGKRVLANYVMYKKILGEEVSIKAIFDNLTQPTQSDYFRAEAIKNRQILGRTE